MILYYYSTTVILHNIVIFLYALSLPSPLPPPHTHTHTQVILHSHDMAFVTECVMTIMALLYPLQYLFPVIPLLPTSMPTAENVSVPLSLSLSTDTVQLRNFQ